MEVYHELKRDPVLFAQLLEISEKFKELERKIESNK